ncbi:MULTISPECIES: hypothetical protein [Pseudomonas]|uniref:hypothetical protein n=1 Tax=Pseudomonas nitroreducens TaxID=46680 RepID=UPI001E590D6D|nr:MULTISPECIES: hypothetical protein [Pseudomonas]MCE4073553.1 hypothetical protein [Pseudomonas nitritireducens]MCE4079792.1 hypothetical protein [Pseudomonas nitroreducens]
MATVNPWKKFIGLLPGGAKTVGEVVSVNASAGTCVVELRTGSQVVARGTSVAVGQNAFISDGQVMGQAPSLPQYDFEV